MHKSKLKLLGLLLFSGIFAYYAKHFLVAKKSPNDTTKTDEDDKRGTKHSPKKVNSNQDIEDKSKNELYLTNQTEVLNLEIKINQNENIKTIDFDLEKILQEYDLLDENKILEVKNKILLDPDNHVTCTGLMKMLGDYKMTIEELLCALIDSTDLDKRYCLDTRFYLLVYDVFKEFNADYNPKNILLTCFRYCYMKAKNNNTSLKMLSKMISLIGALPHFYEICKYAVHENYQNLIDFCKDYFDCFLSNIGYENRKIYWNYALGLQKMVFSNYDNLSNVYEILAHKDKIQDLLRTNIEVDTVYLIAKQLFDFINDQDNIEKITDILFLSEEFKNEFYEKFHNEAVKSNNYSLVGSYLYGQQSLEKKEKIYQINLDCFNELINKIKHLYSDYEEIKMMSEALNIFQLLVVIANHENNKLNEIITKLSLLLKNFIFKETHYDEQLYEKLLYCIKLSNLYNLPASLKQEFIEVLNSIVHKTEARYADCSLNKFFEIITRTYVNLLIEDPENLISDNLLFDSYDQFFYDFLYSRVDKEKAKTFINSGLYLLMQEFFNRGNYSIIKNETIFHIGDYSINILLNYYFSDLGYRKGIIFARYFNGFKEMINTEKDIEKISAFINYFKIPLETNTEKINILMSPDDTLYKKFLQKCSNQFVSLNDPGFKEFLKNNGLLDNQVEEDFLQHNDQNYTLSSIKKYYEHYVFAVSNKNLISTEQYNILCDAFFNKPNADLFMSLFEYFKGPFLHLNSILNSIKNDLNDLEKTQQNILASSISYCFNYVPYCSNKTKCVDTLIDLFKKNRYVIDDCYYKDLKRTCDEDLYWAVEQNQLTLAKTITFLAKNLTGYEKNVGFNIFHLLILNNRPEHMQHLVNFFIGHGETRLLKTLLEKKSEFKRFDQWNNYTPLEKLNRLIDEEKNKGDNDTTNENLKKYVSMKNTLEFANQFVKNDKSLSF